jgi:hypothetical protein
MSDSAAAKRFPTRRSAASTPLAEILANANQQAGLAKKQKSSERRSGS